MSQASLGRQQAFVAPCANAAVISISVFFFIFWVISMLPGCQNWIPHLRAVDFCHVHKSTQSIVAYACSALASLELGDLFLPLLCCKVPVHLSSTCGALRPLSAAVNSNSERCAGRLVALCRTATHGDVCAYSDAFLSRGTRAERDLRAVLYVQDINRCVKARQAVYKAAHQFEDWDTALVKVRTYYHNQRMAATRKRKLGTLNIGKFPPTLLACITWLLWCMLSDLVSERGCHFGCFGKSIQSIGAMHLMHSSTSHVAWVHRCCKPCAH